MAEQDLGHVHERINKATRESMEQGRKIELRVERMQAQMEEQTRNVDRIEAAQTANSERQAALQAMHQELIKETRHMCKAIDDTKHIAEAAREISENVVIETQPAVQDFNERTTLKARRRKLAYTVTGSLLVAAIIGLAVWIVSRITIS